MDQQGKKRVAHTPKFTAQSFLGPDLLQPSKMRKKRNHDNENKVPIINAKKIVASGIVTNNLVLVKEPKSKKKVNEEDVKARKESLRKKENPPCLNEDFLVSQNLGQGDYQKERRRPVKKKFPSFDLCSPNVGDLLKAEDELSDKINPPPPSYQRRSGRVKDWDSFLDLSKPNISENLRRVAPVEYFTGAPLSNVWKEIAVPGIAVELRNPFVHDRDAFWIATLIHFAGYRALAKFESFDNDDMNSQDNGYTSKQMDTKKNSTNYVCWISFCSSVPKPLGFSTKNSKDFYPGPIVPKTVSPAQLKLRLQKFYQEKDTISEDHLENLRREFVALKTVNEAKPVEAIDLKSLYNSRVARISTIQGDRVHVLYYDDDGVLGDEGLWLSYKSDELRPFGWSHTVGIELCGNPRDLRCLPLSSNCFPPWPSDKIVIEKGMLLETRHPYLPWKITGAKVVKIYNHGYFKIRTLDNMDFYRTDYLYHITSPLIFCVGFAAQHNIQIEHYDKNEGLFLQLNLLPPRPAHSFVVGNKMEVIDPVNSCFCGGATVRKIAGHMLYLHYDNWSVDCLDNYCWVDVEKSDIFPAGYTEMVSFDFQGHI